MLDLIGAIVGMTAVAVNLVVFTHALGGTLARRVGVAAAAGAWVGLASGLGAAGKLAFTPDNPVPLTGVLFATPLLVVGLWALRSQRLRTALTGIPTHVLIGLNSMRLLGAQFLLLAAVGRLSGPFPYFAALGDMITAVVAIPLAVSMARSGQVPAAAVRSWNIFGAVDLIVAVSLGVTSASGPTQLIHAGAGSEAMQWLPFCLVPTVLVPFYLITHGIVAAQLAAPRTATRLSHV